MTPNKLTLADLDAEIANEAYFTAHDGIEGAAANAHEGAGIFDYEKAGILVRHTDDVLEPHARMVTICLLVLRNGHKVVGINHGPVDPANFDAEAGRQYAREDAINKLWEPLGFRLRDQLANARPALTAADAAADLAGTPRPDWKG